MKLKKPMYFLGFILLLAATFTFVYSNNNTQKESVIEPELSVFNSTRVPLSFKYPKDFPISVAEEKFVNRKHLDETLKEAVNFAEEYTPNAGSDTYGYIVAITTRNDNLLEYIESTYTTKSVDQLIIEEVKLENVNGYRVNIITNSDYGDVLGPIAEYTYYFYSNGLIYQMALTNPSYLESDPEEIQRIYEDIILPSLDIN